jgi:hypothetical protein
MTFPLEGVTCDLVVGVGFRNRGQWDSRDKYNWFAGE